MGQSLMKLTPAGADEKKAKEMEPIIEQFYDIYFGDKEKKWESAAEFYHAICEAVQEINKKMGNNHFRIPHYKTIKHAYDTNHYGENKSVSKDEFQKILREIVRDTGISGGGIKDMLYIIGVPVSAWFLKERVAPQSIRNDIFIPGVTSATVFVLAQLNKI